jgi:hypothetical protein
MFWFGCGDGEGGGGCKGRRTNLDWGGFEGPALSMGPGKTRFGLVYPGGTTAGGCFRV